jgi:hypothetical protein
MQHWPRVLDGTSHAVCDALAMFETPSELAALDELLDTSFSGAGAHLVEIISPERRLSAPDLSRYLVGVRHLVVASVTDSGEPRCSAVDGLFIHGRFWFTTSAESLKARHLARRPTISGAHVVGDDVGIFVHGQARMVRGGPGEADQLRPYWSDVYDGGVPEEWVVTPEDARYVEIVPVSMFSYAFDRDRFEALCDRPAPEERKA